MEHPTRDELLTAVRAFLADLCHPEGFGFSVTREVRQRARELMQLLQENAK